MNNKLKKRYLVLLVMLLCCLSGIAQTHTIFGTVKDAKGAEIIGATVTAPGTKAGAVTDIDGKF